MLDQPKLETLFWAFGTIIFIIVGSILVGTFARLVAKGFRLSESEQRKIFWGFLFASPWIIGFFIFVVGPALASLYYSFTNYKLGKEPIWTGLDNYRQLIMAEGRDGRNFRSAMFNSLYYAIVGVPLQVGAALGMALILNTAVRGVRLFRLIFYLPVIRRAVLPFYWHGAICWHLTAGLSTTHSAVYRIISSCSIGYIAVLSSSSKASMAFSSA
jgi:multiple sugar transport system permease protein